eukprot:1821345-Pleurochrysis_carterae.AAC.1
MTSPSVDACVPAYPPKRVPLRKLKLSLYTSLSLLSLTFGWVPAVVPADIFVVALHPQFRLYRRMLVH